MKKLISIFQVGILLGLLALTAAAQTSGTIEGVVTDPQNNVVKGATVTITGAVSGQEFTTTTNDEGYFTVRSVQPGTYKIRVEQQGFSAATADNVVVQTGQVARADVGLKVGSVSDTVQVEIGSTDLQVDTSRQNIDGVITGRQIQALPLNARNFLELAILQPGVTVVDGGVIDPTKTNVFRAVRVNGGSGTGTRVQLEGIDVTDETVGTTVANFSTDAVGEFNLQRSSFDLATGLTTSGSVSIASRTGGNKFSGSGFYFKQDDKFDARPGFSTVKPEFNRTQEGYRFGGPIIKNRLFFFSNFERFNQADFSSFTSGDFPALNAESSLPIKVRYALNRVDLNITDSARVFYLHNFNDDVSTGGSLRSPFQNLDWTNTHVIGLNISGKTFTHSVRLGYVNFNNRIASSELTGFAFPVSNGQPYQLNVGDISIGPNSLAPQQTYQDNKQIKYDGSAVFGNHVARFGVDFTKILLGGFANFAGPMTVVGDFTSSTSTNPTAYLLQDFFIGPNAGFFTARPAHGLPFGGKDNTRISWYVGDSWKAKRNLTINGGLRWNYDTNFFSSKDVPRLPQIDVYGAGFGDAAKYPKDAFSPQIGFAWDPWSDGKTSIRGGFNIAYEANIFNNSLFDEFARITTGIGPTQFASDHIVGPTGAPIVVNGIPGCTTGPAAGDYSCLTGRTIASALPFIVQVNTALQAAFGNIAGYNPNTGPSDFALTRGVGFGGVFPGNYEIPYSTQFNIGIQRELRPGHVLSVDYVRQGSHGLPLMLEDFERRRDARYMNEAAIRASIGTRIGQTPANVNPGTIQTFLNANPTASIATFALANETNWPGVTTTNDRARLAVGGRSLYSGLQTTLNGRFGSADMGFLGGDHSWVKGFGYTISYAFAFNKATSGAGRPEFITNTSDNLDPLSDYGPSALDRKHNLTVSANMNLIGGFVLDQLYRFATTAPGSLFIPNNRGTSGIFTADLNGDGGTGTTPRGDLLPGTNIGDFGRRINSIAALNQVLTSYNANFAGQITAHGRRLVAAGIFSEAQLKAIGAVMPIIPLVPAGNPWPFKPLFTADYKLSRPIKIWKETWQLEPSFSVFNVFNQSAKGAYGGLAIPNVGSTTVTNFGAINYAYTPAELPALDQARGLRVNRRQIQFGMRFTF